MICFAFFSFAFFAFASEESKNIFNSAMELYKSNKLEEAIDTAKSAIEIDSKESHYYTFLGNIYNQLEHYDESEKYFKMAIKINSRAGSAFNGLGLIYSHKGLSNKAIAMYKECIKFTPDYYGVYVNIGFEHVKIYENKHDIKQLYFAKEYFEKAIELNNEAYDAYGYLGKVFLDSYDYDNAIKNLEKSINLNPDPNRYYGDFSDTYFNLASAYYNKEMYKEAIDAFQKSLKIKPDAPDAILALGLCYIYVEDKEKATDQLETIKLIDDEKYLILKNEIEKKFNYGNSSWKKRNILRRLPD